jgi:hypothetical protein
MASALALHSANSETAVIPMVGRDHAALAILPFTVASGGTEPVHVSYQIVVDERIRRVDVTLDTNRSVRLPLPSDQTVFLGLLQLSMRTEGGTNRLAFSRRALFDLLQWSDRHDGYTRLRESLQRLTALTITTHAEMLSRDGRPYRQRDQAVHLIDRYDLGNGYDAECLVVWGDIVNEGFALGDFKRLDWDLLLSLGNPTAMQLYRLLDRVILSGKEQWDIGWRPLAAALGMKAESYSRPARFREVVQPHIDKLLECGVIDGCNYARGGQFVFFVRNYLRAQLRQALLEQGVFEEEARKLVSGFDETTIMAQVDCLQHGSRPSAAKPGGYLSAAIRGAYELRYPDTDLELFAGIWDILSSDERDAYHAAGLRLCGDNNLFNASDDTTAWEPEFRAVVRFMVRHNLDPDHVLPRTAGLLPRPIEG